MRASSIADEFNADSKRKVTLRTVSGKHYTTSTGVHSFAASSKEQEEAANMNQNSDNIQDHRVTYA